MDRNKMIQIDKRHAASFCVLTNAKLGLKEFPRLLHLQLVKTLECMFVAHSTP